MATKKSKKNEPIDTRVVRPEGLTDETMRVAVEVLLAHYELEANELARVINQRSTQKGGYSMYSRGEDMEEYQRLQTTLDVLNSLWVGNVFKDPPPPKEKKSRSRKKAG